MRCYITSPTSTPNHVSMIGDRASESEFPRDAERLRVWESEGGHLDLDARPTERAGAGAARVDRGGTWTALEHSYEVDVLLGDGSVATIRTVRSNDLQAIQGLHSCASDDSLYRRFFNLNRDMAAHYVAQLCADATRLRRALLVESQGRVVALATADLIGPTTAEVSFLVDGATMGRGVGTLLLEHLAAIHRHDGIEQLVAEVLSSNRPMLAVFSDAGFTLARSSGGVEVHLEMSTAATDRATEVADARERAAETRSLQAVLSPRVVAVVAGPTEGGIGREVLDSVRQGGFTGRLVTVGPTTPTAGDVAVFSAIAEVPERVDLIVVAMPAAEVAEVLGQAADAGVRAAVVLSDGFGDAGPSGLARQHSLVQTARRGGMRLVGPNCLGVLSHVPDRFNATYAVMSPTSGGLAIGAQSVGISIAMLDAATSSSLGVAYFVSLGNKADVSGNDLIAAWADDPRVQVAALYLESFGNPLKFARLARHFSESKPLLAVVGGSSNTTAASETRGVRAVFDQAGVIAVTGMSELTDTARLLVSQRPPKGVRLGVVGNGGIGVLAADAARRDGLLVPEVSRRLAANLAPLTAGVSGLSDAVDLGAAASPDVFDRAVQLLLASDEIDALLVVIAVTRVSHFSETADRVATAAAAHPDITVAMVILGSTDPPKAVGRSGIPVFSSADAATRALGHAARYGAWRDAPRGAHFTVERSAVEQARTVIDEILIQQAEGCWLPAEQATALLSPYGVKPLPGLVARSKEEAVRQARTTGFPVVAKAASPGIAHKTEQGLVATGLRKPQEVRAAVDGIRRVLRDGAAPVLIQRQVGGGIELAIRGYRDPTFGPIVMVGAGGVESEVLADQKFLLPPVTDLDASRALRSLRIWPLLDGYRGSPPADYPAVERIVQAVTRLMQDIAEVRELDLNPVIAHRDGVSCVDVKVRVLPTDASFDSLAAPSLNSRDTLR